jgi:hypothetical protein
MLVGISALLIVFGISLGCARLKGNTHSSQEPEPAATTGDVEDVLVPSELKVDRRKSFVHHAPDSRAGVLLLRGRVEINSLVNFFENNMATDNWRLVTSFRSPRTMMIFEKPNRECIIFITKKQFKTEVEIWVAPRGESAAQTLFK